MLPMAPIPQMATVAGEGRLPATDMQDAAMEILGPGAFRSATRAAGLTILAGGALDIGGPPLVDRRRRAADASDPRPEQGGRADPAPPARAPVA